MQWIIYVICGIIVLLAVLILIKEIRKMLKGRCCENCKHCSVKDSCSASTKENKK